MGISRRLNIAAMTPEEVRLYRAAFEKKYTQRLHDDMKAKAERAEKIRKRKAFLATLISPPVKYPRTRHVPWSPGRSDDDQVTPQEYIDAYFRNREVVVTVKMDGENTTFYKDNIHARSINSYGRRPYRDFVRALHEQVRHLIPPHIRVCGENMFAKHSILYENLPSYFLVHSIWYNKRGAGISDRDICLNWDETVALAEGLGLHTVPVLYRGPYDQALIKNLYQAKYDGNDMEGYVVRLASSFNMGDYAKCVAKFVREGHVQTDEHWMHQEIVKNLLKK